MPRLASDNDANQFRSLPGVPPTGKRGELPFTAVVNIRGDRLYHEHIAWDQGTALRQLGLLPDFLPFPYPLPDGRVPAQNKIFEYQVPVAGVQTANKLRDKSCVPSNAMLHFKIREVEKPEPRARGSGYEVGSPKSVNGGAGHEAESLNLMDGGTEHEVGRSMNGGMEHVLESRKPTNGEIEH